jgi:hypothetical protein
MEVEMSPWRWWLGIMMVIASLLTLVADLSVALMVLQTYRWDICEFYEGLVMDWKDQATFVVPPPNGYPALVASNTQINAVTNGCKIGIYNKVPIQDDVFLCPSDEEILGTWECNDVHQDAIMPPEYTEDDIAAYLYSNNMQYVPEPAFTSIINGINFSTHDVAWSSSIDSDTRSHSTS